MHIVTDVCIIGAASYRPATFLLLDGNNPPPYASGFFPDGG